MKEKDNVINRLLGFLFLVVFVTICYACDKEPEFDIDNEAGLSSFSFMDESHFRYHKMISLTKHSKSQYTQGLAIWDKYAFVFYAGGYCKIFDLVELKEIRETQLQSTIVNNHVNCAMFSSTFYKEDDKFPLLYDSQGRPCYVERYEENTNLFEIIQTIYVKTSNYSDYIGQFLVDSQNHKLYYISFPKSSADTNVLYIEIFYIPDLTNQNIILNDADLIGFKEIRLYNRNVLQDGMFYDGHIFLLFGVPETEKCMYVINAEDFTYKMYDMPNGFSSEPEGIAVYANHILMSTNYPLCLWDLYDF